MAVGMPEDLDSLYVGDYFSRQGQPSEGYADYRSTATHSLSWIAALLTELPIAKDSILDVGCADGFLLERVAGAGRRAGIEPNPGMAEAARGAGIDVIGSDLLAPALESERAQFDLVSAIAVLEHLDDIRAGAARCLDLLRPHGVMVFEIPLLDGSIRDAVWLTSSLEHVWYPTCESIEWLFGNELGLAQRGVACEIVSYGQTYFGVVGRYEDDVAKVWDEVLRLTRGPVDQLTPRERWIRFLFDVVYRADSSRMAELEPLTIPETIDAPKLLERICALLGAAQRHQLSVNDELAASTAAQAWWREQATRWEHAAGVESASLKEVSNSRDWFRQQAERWESIAKSNG
jgi:SAM-dependent methyltransferase